MKTPRASAAKEPRRDPFDELNTSAPNLAALASFITPGALDVARSVLGITDEIVGLLIAKAINPYLKLSQEQEAALRGVTAKTLRGMLEREEVGPI